MQPRARARPSSAPTPRGAVRRLSTETKAAFKTTEFFAYLAVLAGILVAGVIVDNAGDGGLGASKVWLYATVLTVGYMSAVAWPSPAAASPTTTATPANPLSLPSPIGARRPVPSPPPTWTPSTNLPVPRAGNRRLGRPLTAVLPVAQHGSG